MQKVSDINSVLKAHDIVVVEFSGDRCPGCEQMRRTLEGIEGDFKDIFFCEVNVDENPDIAGQFFVMSVPAVFIIADGIVIDQVIGSVSKDKMREKLLFLGRHV